VNKADLEAAVRVLQAFDDIGGPELAAFNRQVEAAS
jgi:hypothetical protein